MRDIFINLALVLFCMVYVSRLFFIIKDDVKKVIAWAQRSKG